MGENKAVASWLGGFYGDTISVASRCAIWTSTNKKHKWCNSIEKATEVAISTADEDTYFTMGVFPKGVTKRTKDNVMGIFGVWLDVDTGDKDNGKTYLSDIPTAIEWVMDALAGKWTHIVHSGGGLHVYLMFDEPFMIESDKDRETAELAVKAYWSWASSICPGDIDPLTDLSRIMRLPGTMNTRSRERCNVIESCDTAISITDLIEILPEVSLAETCQVAGIDGEVDIASLKDRIALMISADLTFSDTWNRKRQFNDRSPSGYCLSLANQFCMAGLSNAEVAAALEMWRATQLDAKSKPPEWYQTTIGKARAIAGVEGFDERLTAAVLETDDEQKENVVAEVFGARLLKFVKNEVPRYKGNKEKVSYTMKFEAGTIEIPSTAVLLQQKAIRELMFEHLGIVFKTMKGPQFDKVMTLLLGVMEGKELDLEGNIAFAVEGALANYVAAKKEQCQIVQSIKLYESHQIFKDEDESLYYNWNSFKIRLRNVDININNKELARVLRGLGSKPKQFADSKRTRLWLVPDGIYSA